jgi:hypothetical protein
VRQILIALALTTGPAPAMAQGTDLDQAAQRARQAWSSHNAAAQAAALLTDFLTPAQEVETQVLAAREVGPGRGYVELQRRYRVAGTQNVRVQVLLLGYRLDSGGWSLVEFRVVR